jgi:hypothetical protein
VRRVEDLDLHVLARERDVDVRRRRGAVDGDAAARRRDALLVGLLGEVLKHL